MTIILEVTKAYRNMEKLKVKFCKKRKQLTRNVKKIIKEKYKKVRYKGKPLSHSVVSLVACMQKVFKSRMKSARTYSSQQVASVLGATVFIVCLIFEYKRMYQIEIAKKIAVTMKGIPAQCQPSKTWNEMAATAANWLMSKFSWSSYFEDPCQEYSKALHVDIWINPLDVLISLVMGWIGLILEMFSRTLGICFGFLLHKLPPLIQICIILAVILLICVLLFLLHIVFRSTRHELAQVKTSRAAHTVQEFKPSRSSKRLMPTQDNKQHDD